MKSNLYKILVLFLFVLLTFSPKGAYAQRATDSPPKVKVMSSDFSPTKQEQVQVDRVMSFLRSMEDGLVAALEKVGVMAQMRKDMERIVASKDDDQRIRQIRDYQQRYRDKYALAWKMAGFERDVVLKRVRSLAPSMSITMVQGFGFEVVPKRLNEGSVEQPPVEAAPLKSIDVARLRDFELIERTNISGEQDVNLGGFFGAGIASASAREDELESTLVAFVNVFAGATAKINKVLDLPFTDGDEQYFLRVRGVRKVGSYAVGLGGGSYCAAGGRFQVGYITAHNSQDRVTDVLFSNVSSASLAPIAWATWNGAEELRIDQRVELNSRFDYFIEVDAGAAGISALVATSGGSAKARDVVIELETVR